MWNSAAFAAKIGLSFPSVFGVQPARNSKTAPARSASRQLSRLRLLAERARAFEDHRISEATDIFSMILPHFARWNA